MEALTTGWLGILGVVWIGLTLLWIALLAYRTAMASREEDQLFLGKGDEHMAADQQMLVGKLTKLGKPIWVLGVASGGLFLTIIALWIWMGLRANL
jgi:hypothetical protein